MAVQGFLPPGSAVPLNPYNPGLPPQVAAVVGGRAASVASAPPAWYYDVANIFTQAGVPASVWLPIAQTESDLNTGATNPNSGAQGLFQIMPAHHVGYDPVAQARWAAPQMRDAMRRTGSTNPVTVAINSDWPGNIAYLPGGINYPDVQQWIGRFNRITVPLLQNPASQLSQLIAGVTQGGTPEPAPIGGVEPDIHIDGGDPTTVGGGTQHVCIPNPAFAAHVPGAEEQICFDVPIPQISIPAPNLDVPNPFYGIVQWANEHRGAAVFIPLGIGLVVVGLIGLAFAGAQQVASSPGGQAAIAGATGGTSAVVRSVAVSTGVRRARQRSGASGK